MERYEIGDDERLAAMVDAAARGEEAVFTKDGEEVGSFTSKPTSLVDTDLDQAARVELFRAKLRAVHAAIPPGWQGQGAAMIREMRDMSDH